MKGQGGLAKTPAFTKPAGRGALDRRDVCDGDSVTLKGSIATESHRAPRSGQVHSQQWKQRQGRPQLAAYLCRKTPEVSPVRHSKNIAAVQNGLARTHEQKKIDDVAQDDSHGMPRNPVEL